MSALVRSPYAHISLILLAPLYPIWRNPDWWSDPITVIPSLLGFSLGALTIFTGFGNDKFRNAISGERPARPGKTSPYLQTVANFIHFIFIQTLAVGAAIMAKGIFALKLPADIDTRFPILWTINVYAREFFWGACYWLFLYALFLVIASVLSVFSTARFFDQMRTIENSHEEALDESKGREAPEKKL